MIKAAALSHLSRLSELICLMKARDCSPKRRYRWVTPASGGRSCLILSWISVTRPFMCWWMFHSAWREQQTQISCFYSASSRQRWGNNDRRLLSPGCASFISPFIKVTASFSIRIFPASAFCGRGASVRKPRGNWTGTPHRLNIESAEFWLQTSFEVLLYAAQIQNVY